MFDGPKSFETIALIEHQNVCFILAPPCFQPCPTLLTPVSPSVVAYYPADIHMIVVMLKEGRGERRRFSGEGNDKRGILSKPEAVPSGDQGRTGDLPGLGHVSHDATSYNSNIYRSKNTV